MSSEREGWASEATPWPTVVSKESYVVSKEPLHSLKRASTIFKRNLHRKRTATYSEIGYMYIYIYRFFFLLLFVLLHIPKSALHITWEGNMGERGCPAAYHWKTSSCTATHCNTPAAHSHTLTHTINSPERGRGAREAAPRSTVCKRVRALQHTATQLQHTPTQPVKPPEREGQASKAAPRPTVGKRVRTAPQAAHTRTPKRHVKIHHLIQRVMSHMNEACHVWMSHVTYEWVMPCRFWMSHVTYG